MLPSWTAATAAIVDALSRLDLDFGRLALAWARAMPSILLVPAFGLRALPPPSRAVLGLALAGCIFPAITPLSATETGAQPWALRAVVEAFHGLPIALAAAIPLWAATMAGGVADALRGAQEAPGPPVVEGHATPLGIPLSLLASALFIEGGGPGRVAEALALRPWPPDPFVRAAHDLAAGVSLAVALAGPLLAASVVVEIAAALVARAASPAQVHVLLAPLRALAALSAMALVLGRLAWALGRAVAAAP
ncbi:MAG TPA: flagellar biosynthetic protein FliR [Polyangiaceae bacterium]|nr:flagellar biosynthetic protein FliR [Polyangiaceae bacterium]